MVHADDLAGAVVAHWYAEPVARGIYRSVPYTASLSTTEISGRVERRIDA